MVNGDKNQNPNHATISSATGRQNGTDKSSSSTTQVVSSATAGAIKKDSAAAESAAEVIFSQRRRRLLIMLGQTGDKARVSRPAFQQFEAADDDGPPFTIQRIAEVLIAPERVSHVFFDSWHIF